MKMLNHTQKWLILVTCLMSITSCGSKQDQSNTEDPTPLKAISSPQYQFNERWDVNTGSGTNDLELRLRPVLNNKYIYTIDTTGTLTAFFNSTGKKRWQQHFDFGAITGGLTLSNNKLYFTTNKGTVVCVSAIDGQLHWQANVSSEVLAPVAANESTVVVHTLDGKLFALNTETGKRIWVYDRSVPVLSLRGSSAPLINNQNVIAGFANGKVAILSLSEGIARWERRVAIPSGKTEVERIVDIDADPIISGNTLFAATYQGYLAAININTGHEIWRKSLSTHKRPATDQNNVYIATENDTLKAFDKESGILAWENTDLKGRKISAPKVFKGCIIVGDESGYLHCISRKSGELMGRSKKSSSGPIQSAPIAYQDTLYSLNQSGELSAYQLIRR